MKCCFNQLKNILNLILVNFCVTTIIISVSCERPNQFKNINKMFLDFDYLVSQLYVQHCTFVEVGEGVCSLFVKLPVNSDSSSTKLVTRQMFFGNCLCSEFRSWQLCSRQLSMQRPDDCVFKEGMDSPSSSARVHRRLCDVSGMSQWNPQCNCSTTLAGRPQESLCGFRTCYANPMPASICTPRTVCGTARCDLSLHGTLYAVKCDRRCKYHLDFCETTGSATSEERIVKSEWSPWRPISSDEKNSVQQFEAKCLDPEKKPAFDCIGPGLLCCDAEDLDCICEVKTEGGHMKVYRYIIAFNTQTEDSSSKCDNVRGARSVGLKGQTKVWNRFMDLSSKKDNSDSLFSQNMKQKIHYEPAQIDKILPNPNHKPIPDERINQLLNGNPIESGLSNNASVPESSNTIENGVDVKQSSDQDVSSANNPLNTKVSTDYLADSALHSQGDNKSNLFGKFKLTKPSHSQNMTRHSGGNIHASNPNSNISNEDSSNYHYSAKPSKESENTRGVENSSVSKDNNSLVNGTNKDLKSVNEVEPEESYQIEAVSPTYEDEDINAIKVDETRVKQDEKNDKSNFKESKSNSGQKVYRIGAKSVGDHLINNKNTAKNGEVNNVISDDSGINSLKERKISLNENQDVANLNRNNSINESSTSSKPISQISTAGNFKHLVVETTEDGTECLTLKMGKGTTLLQTQTPVENKIFVEVVTTTTTTTEDICTSRKQSESVKSSSKEIITTTEMDESCQTVFHKGSSATSGNGIDLIVSAKPHTTQLQTKDYMKLLITDQIYSNSTEHSITVTPTIATHANETLLTTAMEKADLNGKPSSMPLGEIKDIAKPKDSSDKKDSTGQTSSLNSTQALKDGLSKANESSYDEPEPVLKDLDKTENVDNLEVADDSVSNALNEMIGKPNSDKLTWRINTEDDDNVLLKQNQSESTKNNDNHNSLSKMAGTNKKGQMEKTVHVNEEKLKKKKAHL